MGSHARPHGRQVRLLNLTPVPPNKWVLLVPIALTAALMILATRFITLARISLLHTAQANSSRIDTATNKVMDTNFHPEILAMFTPEVQAWETEILHWSNEYALPSTLIALVMQIESCGAPNVQSPAGAIGLFQVMPFHFSSQEDPYDPQVNATRGLNYLARSYELANGSIALTLAGYNGGHSTIDLDPNAWPEETRRYVRWGTGIWGDIQAHEGHSDTLERWLAAGGERLCRAAYETQTALRTP
jgi:soluble lytic murein transglycosylase-like protein